MWVHNLDPFLWQISGDFGIRWYGLSYLAGFVVAYLVFQWFASRQRAGLSPVLIGDFLTYLAIGTLVGGRLGYCLFYSPELFLQFKPEFPFWGVLAVNEGGMASHGGMIGLSVACILFSIKHNIHRLYLFDLMCVAGPIGVFFGRVANFINGELVGRPSPEGFPLSVKFPSDIYLWPSSEPQRLASLSEVVDKVGVPRETWLEWVDRMQLDSGAREQINQTLGQIVNAIQSGNEAAREAIAPFLTARYPSQLFAAVGEGLFIFFVLFFMWRTPRRPGVITALFISLYAIVRIAGEHFRMPDAHIGYQIFGLTRGQILSIVMLFIGLVLLFFWGRRHSLPIPGWGQGQSVKLHRK